MKLIIRLLSISILIILLTLSSCSDDETVIPNEEELITTLIFTLTPDGGGTPVVFSFRDLDGDGGNDPVIVNGILDPQRQYSGSIQVLNESESPAEDITLEVEEEAEEHQFFFAIENGLNLTFEYDDLDADQNEIGLETVWITGFDSSGDVTITLQHEPMKPNTGLADAGGETDIEVTFEVTIAE